MLEHYGHGGDLNTAERLYGRPRHLFIDFSSNMNPWGPPACAREAMLSAWEEIAAYPDPAARKLRAALSRKYGVPVEAVWVGNGAAELIDLVMRLIHPKYVTLLAPGFAEYETAVRHAGGEPDFVPLSAGRQFVPELEKLMESAERTDAVLLGNPNNPTGQLLPSPTMDQLLHSGKQLVIDEAFLDFSGDEKERTLIGRASTQRQLFVIRSLTKFYSIPGVRLGFVVAHPDHIAKLRELAVPWSVNTIAMAVGEAVLQDYAFAKQTMEWLPGERLWLKERLSQLGLQVFSSAANFLLVRFPPDGPWTVKEAQSALGAAGVLIRDASLFRGLDETYFRTAIKNREENERLVKALRDWMETVAKRPRPRLARTIMVQGTSSDVGKSVISAALCRIFTNEGWKVAPFKSQNMSLNSYITPDGKEIGRAQGVQADACRIRATTDMNPILLKPTGDRSSQVVVHGIPLRDYDAFEYRESYLPAAEKIVKDSLQRLRETFDVVVMEGAGSPAEVNLRDRDIVNMRAAGWADAPVILVADIDRGGVFASIIGTMEIFTPEERDRVKGFIINKFRGDVSLLCPGLDWLEERTGKPVLGVIPYLPDIGLEEEDSAGWQDRVKLKDAMKDGGRADVLDIAVIRFSRISNFTDFDAFLGENDARIRYISSLEEWGRPDAVILPGTKNTMEDLLAIRTSGLERKLLEYAASGGRIVGICGGYQMLGRSLADPHGVESGGIPRTDAGLGLLPLETIFSQVKRTVRVTGMFAGWNRDGLPSEPSDAGIPIEGYEIHMGRTKLTDEVMQPFLIAKADLEADSLKEGAAIEHGRIWGTYLHGIFDNDEFRRCWLNQLRIAKGWDPLTGVYLYREHRESAFDRLAEHVRNHVDMDAIRQIAGI